MASPAVRTSVRSLSLRMCINGAAILVDGVAEVWVTDHRLGEEIDRAAEGGFERIGKGEVVLAEILRFFIKLDDEIKVAGQWVVVVASGRTENIEPLDVVGFAEVGKIWEVGVFH